MSDNAKTLEDKMRVLKVRYLEQLSDRLEYIESAFEAIKAKNFTAKQYEELRSQAHKMSGTGTTYGFPEISKAAKSLEEALIDQKELPDSIEILINNLVKSCQEALACNGTEKD